MTTATLDHLRRCAERNQRYGEPFTVVDTNELLDLLDDYERLSPRSTSEPVACRPIAGSNVGVMPNSLSEQAEAINQLGGLP